MYYLLKYINKNVPKKIRKSKNIIGTENFMFVMNVHP